MNKTKLYRAFLTREFNGNAKYLFTSEGDGYVFINYSLNGEQDSILANEEDLFSFFADSMLPAPQGWETITFRWVDGYDRMPEKGGRYEWRAHYSEGVMAYDSETGEWESELDAYRTCIKFDQFQWKEIRETA